MLNKFSLFSNRWHCQNSVCVVWDGNASMKKYYKQAWNSVHVIPPNCKQLFFHSVKHVEFRAQKRVFAGNFTRAPKKFEDEEFQALLDEDSCQTLAELAKSLGIGHATVLKRFKALELIQKQGNCVPYELKPRDVERHLYTCEQLL